MFWSCAFIISLGRPRNLYLYKSAGICSITVFYDIEDGKISIHQNIKETIKVASFVGKIDEIINFNNIH